jgi:hypothetical protein
MSDQNWARSVHHRRDRTAIFFARTRFCARLCLDVRAPIVAELLSAGAAMDTLGSRLPH